MTLIEMAVVLVVSGVIIGGGLVGVARYSYDIKARQTTRNFNAAIDALSVYAQRYDRLPCPADPNGDGMERGWSATTGVGNCIDTSSLENMYAKTEGVLPWRELGLPQSAAMDGWGHYLTYKPAPQLTLNNYAAARQNLSNTVLPAGQYDVSNACRGIQWFDQNGNFVNRAKALFCCMAAPTPTFLQASTAQGGLGLPAGTQLPANWRTQATLLSGQAGNTAALNYYMQGGGSNMTNTALTMQMTPTNGTSSSTGGTTTNFTSDVASSGLWTDSPTDPNLNGSFATPTLADTGSIMRASGVAVTLISHGGNGFLSYMPNKPATTLEQGSVSSGTLTPSASMSVDEELNVWPPQLANAVVYNPKTANGTWDPMGLIHGASDDRVVMLRADQLMSRVGGSGCIRAANAAIPMTSAACPFDAAISVSDPNCKVMWGQTPIATSGTCSTTCGSGTGNGTVDCYQITDPNYTAPLPNGPGASAPGPYWCQTNFLVAGPAPGSSPPTGCTTAGTCTGVGCVACTGCANTWTVSTWGTCSGACGGGTGTQTGPGTCTNPSACPCPASAGPPTCDSLGNCTQTCTNNNACPNWVCTQWGTCSSTCGTGTQKCVTEACSSGGVLTTGCTGSGPVELGTTQSCSDNSGCNWSSCLTWSSPCSSTCQQTCASANCLDASGNVMSTCTTSGCVTNCPSPVPVGSVTQSCTGGNCPKATCYKKSSTSCSQTGYMASSPYVTCGAGSTTGTYSSSCTPISGSCGGYLKLGGSSSNPADYICAVDSSGDTSNVTCTSVSSSYCISTYNGVCSSTVKGACTSGTPANIADDSVTTTWQCVGGGSPVGTTASCQMTDTTQCYQVTTTPCSKEATTSFCQPSSPYITGAGSCPSCGTSCKPTTIPPPGVICCNNTDSCGCAVCSDSDSSGNCASVAGEPLCAAGSPTSTYSLSCTPVSGTCQAWASGTGSQCAWTSTLAMDSVTCTPVSSSYCASKYYWVKTGTGACTPACGSSSSPDTYSCEDNNGNVVASSNCTGSAPVTTTPCISCTDTTTCPNTWTSSGWSSCSAGCTQTRTTSCNNANSLLCPCTSAQPSTSQSCTGSACYVGACGPDNGLSFSTLSSTDSGLCGAPGMGTPVNFAGTGPWTWDCSGPGGNSPTCMATKTTYAFQGCTAWGSCSAACGPGTQTCTADVCLGSDGNTYPAANCGSMPTQGCDLGACTAYSWYISSWGSCSVTCGGGTQTANYSCQDDSNPGVAVASSNCTSPQPSPAATQSCNTQACATYSWVTGSWGSCSTTCGAGSQARSVNCEDGSGNVVASSNCSGTKPATSQSCTSCTSCGTATWTTGSWGSCAAACGASSQTRSVTCTAGSPSSASCPSSTTCSGTKPATSQSCTSCSTCGTATWTTGSWSNCSSSCTQTRSVTCTAGSPSNAVCSSSTTCSGTKPATSQSCTGGSCPVAGTCDYSSGATTGPPVAACSAGGPPANVSDSGTYTTWTCGTGSGQVSCKLADVCYRKTSHLCFVYNPGTGNECIDKPGSPTTSYVTSCTYGPPGACAWYPTSSACPAGPTACSQVNLSNCP